MKYFISVLFFTLITTSSFAQVDKREIFDVADGFLNGLGNNITLKKELNFIIDSGDTLAYVVKLSPKGYIVLSPTKKLTPVLAFSFEQNFDFNPDKNNVLLNMIIIDMSHQLKLAKDKSTANLQNLFAKNKRRWEHLGKNNILTRSDEIYGPWLTSVWGGVNCKDEEGNYVYVGNYYTPNNYSPGCVSTSMVMIMHRYRWPKRGMLRHTDYDNSGSSQGNYSADFGKTNYNWGNMLDLYHHKQSTDSEREAMGLISYHYGIAVDMDYEYNGSTSNINRSPAALDDYFRYTGHYQTKSWSSFWSRMYENMQNGHPVQLAISDVNGHGHAPTVDGYWSSDTLSDKYYHLNMGWWGSSNGWYALQGTWNAGGYTIVDAGVFDILPDPQFEEMPVQNTDTFTLRWNIADNVQCDSFELQKYISGSWTTITTTANKFYTDTVFTCGNHKYRVRGKIDEHWYYNNYSETCNVFVKGAITSLYFDGDDSYFVNEHDNLLDVNGSDWTIETWIYPTLVPASSTYPAIISRKYSFEMYFRNTSGNLGVGIIAFDGSGTGFNIIASLNSGSSYLTLNEWHHIAASRSGSTTKLFIDGTQVGSSTDPDFDLDASIAAVNFGARYDGGYKRYIDNCKLDDIRYSKTARYTSNFTVHKYDHPEVDADDIFMFYLDEGTGRDITDSKGNFQNIKLRYSPNDPGWSCNPYYQAYYVDATNGDDTNPGTESDPWKTIAKVNSIDFGPGDHIYLKRGESWNEYLYFDENDKGTDYAHIIVLPYDTGDKPVLEHEDYGVILNGSSYMTIKNLSITSDLGFAIKDDSGTNIPAGINILYNIINDSNGNGNANTGIYITNNANNLKINHNSISGHYVGIWIGDENNVSQICNNIISNNSISEIDQNGIGISYSDCSEGDETVLEDNTIYNCGFHGIELSGRYYIVQNNLIYDNGQDSQGGASGIHTFSRYDDEEQSEDKGGDHNTIRYNTVYGTLDHTGAQTDGNGIQMDMWCDSNLIYNNICYDNDGAGIILYGASGNSIYNNTMYGNGQDLGVRYGQYEMMIAAAQLSGSNGNGYLHSENNKVKNNIGMATGSETQRYAVAICDTSILDNNIFENNLWYNNSGSRNTGIIDLINHTTTEKTITEWNAYSWTNSEYSADPLFLDASNNDFHLNHLSPAIDIGQNLTSAGIDDDKESKPRPLLNNYDAGAYEHGKYWIGKYSSTWSDSLNWNDKSVPDASSCVTILHDYDYFPVVLKDITIRKIVLSQNAKLKVMQEKKLNVLSN